MRILLFLLFLPITSTIPAQDAAITATLDRAQQAMGVADYASAVQAYEEIIADGYTSPALYLNLGNAYLRQDDLGRAILAYERGLRLDPGSGDLRHNLELAYRRQQDAVQSTPTFFLVRWWRQAAGWLGVSGWGIVFLVLLWLSAAAFAAHIAPRLRVRWGRGAGIVLLLCSLLPLALALGRRADLRRQDTAVVLAPVTELRVAPGADAPVEGEVHEGLRVRLVDTFNEWRKVELGDGRQGWLAAEVLEVI